MISNFQGQIQISIKFVAGKKIVFLNYMPHIEWL